MLFFVSIYFSVIGVRQKAGVPHGGGGVFLFLFALCSSDYVVSIESFSRYQE